MKGEWTDLYPVGSCSASSEHRHVEMMDDEAGLWFRCPDCGNEPILLRERMYPIRPERKHFEPLLSAVEKNEIQLAHDDLAAIRLADIGIECQNGCGPVMISRTCPGCGHTAKAAA